MYTGRSYNVQCHAEEVRDIHLMSTGQIPADESCSCPVIT